MLLVWSEVNSGRLQFSKVIANRAIIPSEWTEPVVLPSSGSANVSPNIYVDGNGKIYVVYAVPLNEGRGIYLTTSEDTGTNWSDPVKIFDAEAAGWGMVDKPLLAMAEGGRLHLLWSRYSLPSGSGSMGLYYSQSDDGGQTWTDAEMVIDKPVIWDQVVAGDNGVVHRLWQEVNAGSVTVWHDYSADNGANWDRSAPVSIFGDVVSLSALASDDARRLNLMQLINRGGGNFNLQHWVWDSQGWRTDQSLDFSLSISSQSSELAATLSNQGELVVILNDMVVDPEDGTQENSLMFTRRLVDLTEEQPVEAVTPTLQPSETPTASPTSTAIPESTPTQRVRATEASNATDSSTNPWRGLLVGGIFVGVVVAIALGAGVWFIREGRR